MERYQHKFLECLPTFSIVHGIQVTLIKNKCIGKCTAWMTCKPGNGKQLADLSCSIESSQSFSPFAGSANYWLNNGDQLQYQLQMHLQCLAMELSAASLYWLFMTTVWIVSVEFFNILCRLLVLCQWTNMICWKKLSDWF